MRRKEKLSNYKSRKERIFLAIDQDGNCVGETYLGSNDDLVFYMSLEYLRNNWIKITKRVKDMIGNQETYRDIKCNLKKSINFVETYQQL